MIEDIDRDYDAFVNFDNVEVEIMLSEMSCFIKEIERLLL